MLLASEGDCSLGYFGFLVRRAFQRFCFVFFEKYLSGRRSGRTTSKSRQATKGKQLITHIRLTDAEPRGERVTKAAMLKCDLSDETLIPAPRVELFLFIAPVVTRRLRHSAHNYHWKQMSTMPAAFSSHRPYLFNKSLFLFKKPPTQIEEGDAIIFYIWLMWTPFWNY